MTAVAHAILEILAWGIVATLVMIAIMYSSQNFGWSRLNPPFLLGTFFTDERNAANTLGFFLYIPGGWMFGFLYYLLFGMIGRATALVGAAVGLVHGILILTALLPLLPYIHPRVASEYDGPDVVKRLEPPGFLALHYGRRTPIITLIAHIAYGAILGAGLSV